MGTDDEAAKALLRKRENDAMLRRKGVIGRRAELYAEAEGKPLSKHLDEFKTALTARKGTAKHVRTTVTRVPRLVGLAKADRIGGAGGTETVGG